MPWPFHRPSPPTTPARTSSASSLKSISINADLFPAVTLYRAAGWRFASDQKLLRCAVCESSSSCVQPPCCSCHSFGCYYLHSSWYGTGGFAALATASATVTLKRAGLPKARPQTRKWEGEGLPHSHPGQDSFCGAAKSAVPRSMVPVCLPSAPTIGQSPLPPCATWALVANAHVLYIIRPRDHSKPPPNAQQHALGRQQIYFKSSSKSPPGLVGPCGARPAGFWVWGTEGTKVATLPTPVQPTLA